MAAEVETTLRGPQAYSVARAAIEMMESAKVWPTALNFELWIHVVAAPDGPLAREIHRIIQSGETITDVIAEELAATYLPKAKLNEQIRDAGDLLTKELSAVSRAIQSAKLSNAAYGATLAGASKDLTGEVEITKLRTMVEGLAGATRQIQKQNGALEKRLAESSEEVARLKEHLEQVRRDATTDGLTNLANRKAFDEELERACAEADSEKGPLILAVLDIDHFKNFNDTWGHQTGDQVLRYVASVIGRVGAPPRFAARYGGEEFAIIFARESLRQVDRTLNEIRQEVSSRMLKRRSTNEDLGTVTISAGFAERKPGESPHSLMERADGALYASKRGGRNRVSNAEAKADAA
ncbi:MAG TPA: GGDEF domain-containing protein [Caulobacteraceae bacterium]|nr:GGDEF domain-containing protein [Caulobacteraceae bacterium]